MISISCFWNCSNRVHSCLCTYSTAVVTELLPSMYSSIAHSCTNNTVVAGYHDSRRNTDTPYRSLWRYICSSCARAGVFPGIPVCPVYRLFLALPLQAGKSGHRLYALNREHVGRRSAMFKKKTPKRLRPKTLAPISSKFLPHFPSSPATKRKDSVGGTTRSSLSGIG